MTSRDVGDLFTLLSVPFYALIFLAIVRQAHRDDLVSAALVGPVIIGLWGTTLNVSAELLYRDRAQGTLEALTASPAPYQAVVLGRMTAVALVAALSSVETWLVARVMFGVSPTIHHPWNLAVACTLTLVGTLAAGYALSAVFALGRSPRLYQNSLTYPIYVLGGALVPVALLPGPVPLFTRLIYLSWCTDLLRDSISAQPVQHFSQRCLVAFGLALGTATLGHGAISRSLRALRASGRLGFE